MNPTETKKQAPDYLIEYETFMSTYKRAQVGGEEVGEVIMRLAAHFGRYNTQLANAARAYHEVKALIYDGADTQTGKPVTASKAEVLADARPEATVYREYKAHVTTIEQMINALKALQKGVLNEYAHAA